MNMMTVTAENDGYFDMNVEVEEGGNESNKFVCRSAKGP